MRRPLPSQARLKELLDYDPLTGGLVWKVRRSNQLQGATAGTKDRYYYKVMIDSIIYKAHRIIWVLQTGEDPGVVDVDHKDLDSFNNCWNNLRLATCSQNNRNVHGRSKKGMPKGVKQATNGYQASIKYQKVTHYLGQFDTPEEAHQAYCEAAARLHGEFVCLA